MLYGNIVNENYFTPQEVTVFELLTQNMNLCMEYCLSELNCIDEAYIPPEDKQKVTMFTKIKKYISKLWESFKQWCKMVKDKLLAKIGKAKKETSSKSNTSSDEKKDEKSKNMIEFLELNSNFDKCDERNLLSEKAVDLSLALRNYDKELYENYNNVSYTQSLSKSITGGLVDNIDELKADMLIDKHEKELDDNLKKSCANTSALDELGKKYDSMISMADDYFNKLQDSVRKAEAYFKKNSISPSVSYSDDNLTANTNNPLEYMRMRKIIDTSVKMIGAQSGIVRNIIYVKVAAINKVIDNRVHIAKM